ncbi:hypothetical protein PAPYR_6416 [Paratrimastix pyriformis]|uniref:Uncharacterized protein n=1 Tax=Paratrimastix pyriformis TaxID=342808 RepID=A0ABQ8UL24_9EUKA|nr:hypothetical protein PAPYR_6416 [Paratrimastix pyriformis]
MIFGALAHNPCKRPPTLLFFRTVPPVPWRVVSFQSSAACHPPHQLNLSDCNIRHSGEHSAPPEYGPLAHNRCLVKVRA